MKTARLLLCLPLAACMQSEHYGNYTYHSTISHDSGQIITQNDHAHWHGGAYTPPQAAFSYHNGTTGIYARTPPPAATPPVYYTYPVYPQPAPNAPYIRSQQTLLPGCTQQRTVRHGGRTITIEQPCH